MKAPVLVPLKTFQEYPGPEMERRAAEFNACATESVGLATGILIAALHHAGLATLTHTPSPMGFLNRILHRPDRERPFLLLVVGYPSPDAMVPDIRRKPLEEIAVFFEPASAISLSFPGASA